MRQPKGISKHDLDTPCLVIDLDTLDRNIASMQAFARSAGKSLRPHAKSHKCTAVARRQRDAGAIGISVATVAEAEALVNAGITGVLLTSPMVTPHTVARLLNCRERAEKSFLTVTDGPEHARLLDDAARRRGLTLDVLLDLDIGLSRTGVLPEEALEAALSIADLPALRFRGVQAYAGHVQHITGWEKRRRASLASMEAAAGVVRRLREAGLPCDILSGTGTGTHDIDTVIPELTEFQVGSYVLMDAEYLGIGSPGSAEFAAFRPALTLLATVVSARHEGFVTIDAGLKALYHDGAVPRVVAPGIPGLVYDWFGDEFGKLTIPEGALMKTGDTAELVVSHCDPTVAMFDRFYIVREDLVVDVWEIDMRRR
jgi:D-serine deaminase-like pyridoxal phosphate-dependent protein